MTIAGHRWRRLAKHLPHNLKVAGSNPAPATPDTVTPDKDVSVPVVRCPFEPNMELADPARGDRHDRHARETEMLVERRHVRLVTATFRRKDGRTLHVRKATRAEPEQQKIFRALGTDPAPGGIRKMIV